MFVLLSVVSACDIIGIDDNAGATVRTGKDGIGVWEVARAAGVYVGKRACDKSE